MQALNNAFAAAKLGNVVLTAQAIEHDPDLIIGQEMPAGLAPDVLYHPLSGGLHRRFLQGGLGLHLRSFVTTTTSKPTVNQNLKFVPLVLTGDTRLRFFDGIGFPDEGARLLVVLLDEAIDDGLQVDDRMEHAVFQPSPC